MDRSGLQPTRTETVQRWHDGRPDESVADVLIDEVPVALEFNGIAYATMLVTPADLEDFARGFALTEGIVDSPQQVYGIDIESTALGIVLHVQIASACAHALKVRRRSMAGRTGCGLCGVESLDQVLRPVASIAHPPMIAQGAVLKAQRLMATRQPMFKATGASHAAALATLDGELIAVREDVGRHNALDKLIGATAIGEQSPKDAMVIVSSRASFEMVQKTLAAGHVALASVSAPTAMAQRLALQHNLTLIGFVRDDRLTVYAGQARVC